MVFRSRFVPLWMRLEFILRMWQSVRHSSEAAGEILSPNPSGIPESVLPKSVMWFLLLTVLCPLKAHADPIVLFNNFGPGDTFDIGGPNTPWMPVAPAPFFLGFSFTTESDAVLRDVTVAISSRTGHEFFEPADAVSLSIRSMGPAGRPTDILDSLRVEGLAAFGEPYSPLTATSEGALLLRGGESYWLTATSVTGLAVWNFNSTGHVGDIVVTDEDDDCCFFDIGDTGAFRVTAEPLAAPVPEPATVLLFGTGAAAIGRRLWKQRARQRSVI